MVGRTGDASPAVATPLTAPLYFGSNFAECPPILKVRLTGYNRLSNRLDVCLHDAAKSIRLYN